MDESAKIDANQQKTLLAVTNAATPEIKNVRCDATTGRVLVSATVSGVSDITVANEATDTSCFPLFATAATGSIQPKTNAGLTFNSNTGNLGATLMHTQKLTVGVAGTATGSIELNGITSGTVTIKTADAAGTYTLTLPTNDGNANQFLQTNGSGVLSWADSGGAVEGTDILSTGETGGTKFLREDGDGTCSWQLASDATKATKALDNLASVAINTDLISDTNEEDDLGSTTKKWANLFVKTIGATGTRVTKGWFTDLESTNMPTVGGTAILSSLTAPQFTSIELGHASDTTLSRSAAGVVSIEGKNIYLAGGADVSPADGGTGVSNGNNNTITFTGNYSLGLTLSNNTSVTLPTSGTLLANVSEDTTPQLGGELDCQAHSIGFTQQTATGDGTTTINWKLGNKFYFTFGDADETFTFIAPSKACNLVLVLKQYSTGGKKATWPNTVMWPGGTAPTLSTGNNDIDIVSFYYDGKNYFGVASLDFSVPA